MRRSRTATTAMTALIGLGTIVSLALPANAETPSKNTSTKISNTNTGGTTGGFNGTIVATPTTPTTQLPKAPAPADYDDFVITGYPVGPVGPVGPEAPQAVDPTNDPCQPVASCPQPEDDCIPSTTNVPNPCEEEDCTPIPGAADCDEDDCLPIPGTSGHNCPGTEDDCEDRPSTQVPRDRDENCPGDEGDCSDDDIARNHCDEDDCDDTPNPSPRHGERPSDLCVDPCVEDGGPGHAVRSAEDCCIEDEGGRPETPRANATTGGTPGGTDGGVTTSFDPPVDRPGDRPERCPGGGTTGGTDGEGRLPRTGTEIMTIAAIGAGMTGIGTALKKLSKRAARKTA